MAPEAVWWLLGDERKKTLRVSCSCSEVNVSYKFIPVDQYTITFYTRPQSRGRFEQRLDPLDVDRLVEECDDEIGEVQDSRLRRDRKARKIRSLQEEKRQKLVALDRRFAAKDDIRATTVERVRIDKFSSTEAGVCLGLVCHWIRWLDHARRIAGYEELFGPFQTWLRSSQTLFRLQTNMLMQDQKLELGDKLGGAFVGKGDREVADHVRGFLRTYAIRREVASTKFSDEIPTAFREFDQYLTDVSSRDLDLYCPVWVDGHITAYAQLTIGANERRTRVFTFYDPNLGIACSRDYADLHRRFISAVLRQTWDEYGQAPIKIEGYRPSPDAPPLRVTPLPEISSLAKSDHPTAEEQAASPSALGSKMPALPGISSSSDSNPPPRRGLLDLPPRQNFGPSPVPAIAPSVGSKPPKARGLFDRPPKGNFGPLPALAARPPKSPPKD